MAPRERLARKKARSGISPRSSCTTAPSRCVATPKPSAEFAGALRCACGAAEAATVRACTPREQARREGVEGRGARGSIYVWKGGARLQQAAVRLRVLELRGLDAARVVQEAGELRVGRLRSGGGAAGGGAAGEGGGRGSHRCARGEGEGGGRGCAHIRQGDVRLLGEDGLGEQLVRLVEELVVQVVAQQQVEQRRLARQRTARRVRGASHRIAPRAHRSGQRHPRPLCCAMCYALLAWHGRLWCRHAVRCAARRVERMRSSCPARSCAHDA